MPRDPHPSPSGHLRGRVIEDRLLRHLIAMRGRRVVEDFCQPDALAFDADRAYLIECKAQDRFVPPPFYGHGLANVRAVTLQVRDTLATLRPESKAGFEVRAAAYVARLDALAAWAQQEVAVLPAARRCLVTNHDAFGYLVRDYGFTVHPLQGVNPEAEPNARELAELTDFIRREKIPAVFADNTENPKLLAAMIRETGAKLGGTLYADGLGAAGTPATTFADMYRHNLGTIVSALK